MKLFVLQPGSSDPEQQFPEYCANPTPSYPLPVGYRGFAACTGGAFVRKASSIPASEKRVLLLLGANLKAALQSIIDLRREGKTVVLALARPSSFEVGQMIRTRREIELFHAICARAHAAIISDRELEPLFRSAGLMYVECIHAPIPVEDSGWDFAVRPETRSGIFLATHNWKKPERRHFLALAGLREIAAQMFEPVTVFNLDGWFGRQRLRQLHFQHGLLQVVEKRVLHSEYLKIMARHKLVFHLATDSSSDRIATDAFLAGLPCVGPGGPVMRVLFPEVLGGGCESADLYATLSRLLDHSNEREHMVEKARDLAVQMFSPSHCEQTLEQLFHYLG